MAYTKSYEDDPAIRDEDRLWRRLHPSQMTFDPKLQRHRPSSAAFNDSSNGTAMSVNIVRFRDDDDPDAFLTAFPGEGLAELTAGAARKLDQGVAHTPDEGGPDHGSVFDKSGSRRRKTRNELAKACTVLREPQGPEPPSSPETI